MTNLSERTLGDRMQSGERPREVQEVTLVLVDGSQLRGKLHRAPGTRTLDYLNRQAETFVALTEAVVTLDGDDSLASFVAINKMHIVRVIEAAN